MTDEPQTEDPMVAALLRERAGYASRKGMEDRVAAVDEQLKLRGYKPPRRQQEKPKTPATPPTPAPVQSDAEKQPPKGRQQPGAETT